MTESCVRVGNVTVSLHSAFETLREILHDLVPQKAFRADTEEFWRLAQDVTWEDAFERCNVAHVRLLSMRSDWT
jgi:hypothetical protein